MSDPQPSKSSILCPCCDEPVLPSERTDPGGAAHFECALRGVIGSVAHLQRRCSCYVPGSSCGDPEGMTRREAARAAVELWRKLDELGVNAFGELGVNAFGELRRGH